MKLTIKIFTFVIPILLITGCSNTGGLSIFESKDYSIGTIVPDIPFYTTGGIQTSFSRISKPIAIMAFTSTPGETCYKLEPELVDLAYELRNKPVTVAQISLLRGKCPHGVGCEEYCSIRDNYLVSLCDDNHIAWSAYGRPEPNTVILVGENNEIVAIETLDNLNGITLKAEKLAAELNKI